MIMSALVQQFFFPTSLLRMPEITAAPPARLY